MICFFQVHFFINVRIKKLQIQTGTKMIYAIQFIPSLLAIKFLTLEQDFLQINKLRRIGKKNLYDRYDGCSIFKNVDFKNDIYAKSVHFSFPVTKATLTQKSSKYLLISLDCASELAFGFI